MSLLRVATFLAPNVYPAYAAITQAIGQRLGCETELVVGHTHDQFAQIAPDVAFICGLPYVLMRRHAPTVEAIAAPVLQGARYRGRPIYFSDVIVRAEAPYRHFGELHGCRWGYNEEVSQSGYGITRHTLLQMGETNGFFGKVMHTKAHQHAIKTLVRGRIDATAIDSQVLAIELAQRPALSSQIKVIDVLGPSSIQPVVVRSDFPPAFKQTLQSILVSLGDDPDLRPILDAALFERFVAVDDSAYDDIRVQLEAAEAAHFLHLEGATA